MTDPRSKPHSAPSATPQTNWPSSASFIFIIVPSPFTPEREDLAAACYFSTLVVRAYLHAELLHTKNGRRLRPEAFQMVVLAHVARKDVNHHVAIIEHHPAAFTLAFAA